MRLRSNALDLIDDSEVNLIVLTILVTLEDEFPEQFSLSDYLLSELCGLISSMKEKYTSIELTNLGKEELEYFAFQIDNFMLQVGDECEKLLPRFEYIVAYSVSNYSEVSEKIQRIITEELFNRLFDNKRELIIITPDLSSEIEKLEIVIPPGYTDGMKMVALDGTITLIFNKL